MSGPLVHATLAVAALAAFTACAGAADTAATGGTRLGIAVAPLTLPDLGDACYAIDVTNADNATVWTRDHLCASDYGDHRGDISFIGTCDADDGDGDSPKRAVNHVHLVLESLSDTNGEPITAFDNPCDGPDTCIRDVECVENADASVTFDITVLRQANQGFFDVAVGFDDIFCSAKIDCAYADGAAIHLLHNPATSQRASTVVLALACTGGVGVDDTTTLHMSDVTIACPGAPDVTVNPAQGLGNQYPAGTAPAPLFQAQVSAGAEALTDAGTGALAHDLYWTVALGVDVAALATVSGTCTVSARMTASNGGDATWVTPGSAYPRITAALDLTFDGPSQELTCGRHALDDSATLATGYAGPGERFAHCLTTTSGGGAAFCPQPAPRIFYALAGEDQSVQVWDAAAGTLSGVGTGVGFTNIRDGAWLGGTYYVQNANANLYAVDVTTGTSTLVATGEDGLGLGAGPDGALYSLSLGDYPDQFLQRWDVGAQTYTQLATPTGYNNARDATFKDGAYYALSAGNLIRVDLTTGVGTLIASGADGLALVAGPGNLLYSVTTEYPAHLQRWGLDGSYTRFETDAGFGNTRDGVVDTAGDYYIVTANGYLVKIDLATGAGTLAVTGADGFAIVAPN